MLPMVKVILGPPGTGKTEKLLGEVEHYLNQGVKPNRIAFVSFTRRAADEAAIRAAVKFEQDAKDFPWFRTIHSLAYRLLNLRRQEVMTTEHFRDLGELVGLEFKYVYSADTDKVPQGGGLGDELLRAYSLARARLRAPEDEWDRSDDYDFHRWSIARFARQLEQYKERYGVIDFCDMLDQACHQQPPDLDVLIVDECQDLTAAQWALVRHIGRACKRVILGGDDDQAIYEWAGADPSYLGRFKAEYQRLPQSFRVPSAVHQIAARISNKIGNRLEKTWNPRDHEGSVEWLPTWAEDLDLSEGSWLLLARHRRQLSQMVELCRREGVVYRVNGKWSYQLPYVQAALAYEALRKGKNIGREHAQLIYQYSPHARQVNGEASFRDIFPTGDAVDWMRQLSEMPLDEREYVRAALRRGESLTKPGRVQVSTIHSVKGAEADNVLLLTSCGRKTRANLRTDAERRVWYVGVTRARERLILAGPEAPVLA